MARTVTRTELYELVWTTPMSRLAAEFGVSDVALAKTCRRWDIPRPGRGYWTQREAGGAVAPRPPLPEARSHDHFVIARAATPSAPRKKPPPPVEVPIPENLQNAAEPVRMLGAKLGTAVREGSRRLVVGSPTEPVLAVTVAVHRRALTLLEGLARVLSQRGHATELAETAGKLELSVLVAGQHRVCMSLVECLEKMPHAMTEAEQKKAERGSSYGVPKYDHVPGGRLQLKIVAEGRTRHSWSDSRTRRLETCLGSVVLALEAELEAAQQLKLAAEQRRQREADEQQQRELEQRRLREAEANRRRLEAQATDLRAKAKAWTEARDLRAFVEAVANAVPLDLRDESMRAWLTWAADYVRALDPLSQTTKLVP